ncbi:hypothetical protein CBR_g46710 [Chara braunii]|uniref:Uncharacterized protein n=1 Tax=Chara braunii TaxID=69332 RepID=A0A388K3W5_CHABU|nr:hypothetical protein CBR_g46710 [Chara braunii]|eukprot:GBG64752.1 hypothetical protein CBR_g46710 [Chara braunii]
MEGGEALVFTNLGCPACHRAKAALKQNGVVYREIDISEDAKAQEVVRDVTGRRSVPVIFINGKYIGGAEELEEAVTSRELVNIVEGQPAILPRMIRGLIANRTGTAPRTSPVHTEKTGVQTPDNRTTGHGEDKSVLEELAWRMVDRKEGLRRSGAFSGAEACAWLVKNCEDVHNQLDLAIRKGRELQGAHLLCHVTFSEPFSASAEEFFRLTTQDDEPAISRALNARRTWVKPTRAASKVIAELRKMVLALHVEAISADGRSVNYTALSTSNSFKKYVKAAEELQRVDLFSLNREEKMAFFINAYNTLVIHAMVESGPPKSVFKRMGFYKGMKYYIGGNDFSLDDIEHGVLRGNRAPPSSFIKNPVFGSTDPRRFHAIVPLEPRIHFALVCGAKSCPPIKMYTPENLDDGLQVATISFCEGEVKLNLERRTVTLSRIFDWYKDDFGETPKERLAFISTFLSKQKQNDLKELIQGGNFKISYSDYNWSLND